MIMAINQVQKKESPIDKILKGLQVANQGFGLYSNLTNISAKKQEMEAQAQTSADTKEGVITKADLLKQGDNYTIADANSPGAMKYKIREGDTLNEVYLAPKAAQGKNTALTQENVYQAVKDGAQLVPPNSPGAHNFSAVQPDGSTKLVGLVPPRPKADQIPNPNKAAFEQLPIENQEQVKKLAGSNANKTAINNQLKATLATLDDPEIPYEQKLMAANNLGKTLNSTEGADAVGEGEAGRMLAFLNYLPKGRPGWDVGPQLDKFTEQVRIKTGDIDKAIASNKQAIDGFYGKSSQVAQLAPPKKKAKTDSGLFNEAKAGTGSADLSQEDLAALAWVRANPKAPEAQKVRAKLMQKGLKP